MIFTVVHSFYSVNPILSFAHVIFVSRFQYHEVKTPPAISSMPQRSLNLLRQGVAIKKINGSPLCSFGHLWLKKKMVRKWSSDIFGFWAPKKLRGGVTKLQVLGNSKLFFLVILGISQHEQNQKTREVLVWNGSKSKIKSYLNKRHYSRQHNTSHPTIFWDVT